MAKLGLVGSSSSYRKPLWTCRLRHCDIPLNLSQWASPEYQCLNFRHLHESETEDFFRARHRVENEGLIGPVVGPRPALHTTNGPVMTADMAFECLIVSRDPGLFGTICRILRELSIASNVCSSSRASDLLDKGSTDLVVIDQESDDSSELLHKIWKGGKWKKPTVLAVSSSDLPLPGAHVNLKKPVTLESGKKSLKAAYSRMLTDYRLHARHVLMIPVSATLETSQKTVFVTVADIGDGGVGLNAKDEFVVGDILSFRLHLSGAPRGIMIRARVLWTRDYGRVGCEFVRIPPVDLTILHDWLKARSQVKEPLMSL